MLLVRICSVSSLVLQVKIMKRDLDRLHKSIYRGYLKVSVDERKECDFCWDFIDHSLTFLLVKIVFMNRLKKVLRLKAMTSNHQTLNVNTVDKVGGKRK